MQNALADLGRANVNIQTMRSSVPVLIITCLLLFIGTLLFVSSWRSTAQTEEEKNNRKNGMISGGIVIIVGLAVFAFYRLSLRYSKAVQEDSTLASFEGAKTIGGALKGLFN